jgi:hypothetical protein
LSGLFSFLFKQKQNKGEYKKENLVPADIVGIERLITILQAFPPEETTRKRFITEMIGWSGRHGEIEMGDPELHHAVGTIYAEGLKPRSIATSLSFLSFLRSWYQ